MCFTPLSIVMNKSKTNTDTDNNPWSDVLSAQALEGPSQKHVFFIEGFPCPSNGNGHGNKSLWADLIDV